MRTSLLVDHVGVRAEAAQGNRGNFDHHVDTACEHFSNAGVGIGDGAEDHRIEGRRTAPVVGVGFDHDRFVGAPFAEGKGAGTGSIPAEVSTVFHHCRWRDDQAGRVSEVGQEGCVGCVQGELHRRGIHHRHVFNRREEERQRERSGVVVGVVLVQHAVEVELDGIGIKGRPIVEAHAFAQGECVLKAIVADVPRGCQRRLDFERPVLVAHQTVVDVHQDAEIVHGRYCRRVQGLGLSDLTDNQNTGWCL
ncbi:MAG: Uncharacterised protein [Rhodospirillaceae bacterium]|nr:MAG: Uncharacterised protein [Rhodospirillaceae bacterium]